jgi:4-amino-4-deoxy-L-arabinose transferase-like glycosyltransferase
LKTENCELKADCHGAAIKEVPETQPSFQFSIFNFQFSILNCTLLLLCGVLFFYRLADRDLWNSHEGRAAQDAQSLLNSGDWLMPRLFDGQPEMQKPPLYYWLVAGVAWSRGAPVDAWAVRVPAALAALLCVLGVYVWGYRRARPLAGFLAAVILASAVHFTWLARVGRIDMPLTLAVGFALLSSFGTGQHRIARLVLAYLAVAVGILLKGPIALALPAVAIAAHLVIERQFPVLWHGRPRCALINRLGLWWGLPLVAAVALPWFLWADAKTHGEWFHEFFWRHNVERGFGGGDPDGHWNHPWWLYGPMFLWDFLPWSIFLPIAAWYWFRKNWWRCDSEARLGLVWLVSMLLVLSCMRFKRSDYLLPAYPGAAIFLGCIAERWYKEASARLLRKWLVLMCLSFGLIILGCVVGWLVNVDWAIPDKEPALEHRTFAARIRASAPPSRRVLFFRTESHALVFHVGQPIDLFVEWEKLDALAGRREPTYVVMPAKVADEWRQHLNSGRLEEIARNTPANGVPHEKPLVLLRTCSNQGSDDR